MARPGVRRRRPLVLLGLSLGNAHAWVQLPSSQSSVRWSVPSRRCCTGMSMSASASDDAVKALAAAVALAGQGRDKLDVSGVFGVLTASDSVFVKEYWQKKPVLLEEPIESLLCAWTMNEVEVAVANEFLYAGRGTFNEGREGWKMAEVGKARGSSFEEAKLRPEDVRDALSKRFGTVVFNSIGGHVPEMASVCLQTLEQFLMPTALNLYLTAAGQQTSAPPHTDKQDVFVLQTQGRKRWRVYAPPPPFKKPNVDPFTRGKDRDQLSLSELDEPLIDTVLSPGQMLYIPGAFPHTTDTVTRMVDETEPSVHMTVGVDTHIWSLTYEALRRYVLGRAGRPTDDPPAVARDVSAFLRYTYALPLGFLDDSTLVEGQEVMRWSQLKGVLVENVIDRFLGVMRDVDGDNAVWHEEEMVETLKLREAAEKIVEHHRSMVSTFRSMYTDVSLKLSESPRDLGFFRSKPYLQKVEQDMQSLVEWGGAGLPREKEAEGGKKGGFGAAGKKGMGKKVGAPKAKGKGFGA